MELTLSTKELTPCRKLLKAPRARSLCSVGPFVMSAAALMQKLHLEGDHWPGHARQFALLVACIQHGCDAFFLSILRMT